MNAALSIGRVYGRQRWMSGLWCFAVLVAGLWLWKNNPAHAPLCPHCLIHAATGFQCPGCGSLRATHALLNGDVAQAWSVNPLFVVAAPLLGVWTLLHAWTAATGHALRLEGMSPIVPAVVGVVLVAYMVVRNTCMF